MVALRLPAQSRRFQRQGLWPGPGQGAAPPTAQRPRSSLQVKQRSLDLAVTRAAAAGLTNVQTWCGDITEYDAPFGLGLALHACGEASDLAMRACVEAGARFVVSPCCVGKLSGAALDPYKFNATGGNFGRITYPRSQAVAAVLDTVVGQRGQHAPSSAAAGRAGHLRLEAPSRWRHGGPSWVPGQSYGRVEPRRAAVEPLSLRGASGSAALAACWATQAADMPGLAPEVRRYEDHAALCGGDDGADVIRDLLRVAPRLLRAEGPRAIWLEVDTSHPKLLERWIREGKAALQPGSAVLVAPPRTALASRGWRSRLLAALCAWDEPPSRAGPNGRLRCVWP